MGKRRYAHSSDFSLVAECFAAKDAAAILGVDAKTLAHWKDGKTRIPWSAYQLLYERSSYGLAERDSIEAFQRQMILGERDSLKQRVAQLEAELLRQSRLVDWGCANDPFINPSDPRSKVLVDTHILML